MVEIRVSSTKADGAVIRAPDLSNADTTTRRLDTATIHSTSGALAALLDEHRPDRVVLEVGPMAGWVADLARQHVRDVQIANPLGEAWKWRHLKRKTDRDDAGSGFACPRSSSRGSR